MSSGKSGKGSKSAKTESLQAYAGLITVWAIIATILYLLCVNGMGLSDIYNSIANSLSS